MCCPHPWGFLSSPHGSLSPSLRVPSPPQVSLLPFLGVPSPLWWSLFPPWGCCPHSQGSHPTQRFHSQGSCRPHSGDSVPTPGVPVPTMGVPSPLWECLSPCWESIPSLGILSEQSQLSAFPQSPAHTSSASGADPPIPASLPIGTGWVCPPRGSVFPWGQRGWQPGLLVGAQPPALPSVLPGGSPGWESPGQGFPHWDAPSRLSLSSGGVGVMLPPDPPTPHSG